MEIENSLRQRHICPADDDMPRRKKLLFAIRSCIWFCFFAVKVDVYRSLGNQLRLTETAGNFFFTNEQTSKVRKKKAKLDFSGNFSY